MQRQVRVIRKIVELTPKGAVLTMNNRPLVLSDQSRVPQFNTTKRLPGTSEFVNKIRPKVVKVVVLSPGWVAKPQMDTGRA